MSARDGSISALRESAVEAQAAALLAVENSKSFEHIQTQASTLWIVNHNLGRWPSSVTVVTVGGVEVDAGVINVSTNILHVEFATPFVGRVRII